MAWPSTLAAYRQLDEGVAERLGGDHGARVLIASLDFADVELVHRVIYDELVHDVVRPESAAAYRGVIARLETAGAEAIIAGCAEIELLIGPDDVAGGFLPTTSLQVAAGIDRLLGKTRG